MSQASFRFIGTLNDFLARPQRGQVVCVEFADHQTVMHLIEALGAPHVEVGEIVLNGRAIQWAYHLPDGAAVEVRPIPAGFTGEARFVLDGHLGRLAALLRMLGFDCLYRNDYDDPELAEAAEHEKRILLSRDRRLLMRKNVHTGYCLRSLAPQEQAIEVMRRFELADKIHPFQRCLRCNGRLESVEKAAVLEQLQPLTKAYYDVFSRCTTCGQVYWPGSHYERMRQVCEMIKAAAG